MESGLLAQYVAIAIAVVASGAYVVRAQWPGAVRRLRVACALTLIRFSHPMVKRIGQRLAPAASSAAQCGGCSSCD